MVHKSLSTRVWSFSALSSKTYFGLQSPNKKALSWIQTSMTWCWQHFLTSCCTGWKYSSINVNIDMDIQVRETKTCICYIQYPAASYTSKLKRTFPDDLQTEGWLTRTVSVPQYFCCTILLRDKIGYFQSCIHLPGPDSPLGLFLLPQSPSTSANMAFKQIQV